MHFPTLTLTLALSLVSANPLPTPDEIESRASKCGQTINVDGESWTLTCQSAFNGGNSTQTFTQFHTYKKCFDYCGRLPADEGISAAAYAKSGTAYYCDCYVTTDGPAVPVSAKQAWTATKNSG